MTQTDSKNIRVNDKVSIREEELTFTTSRSSGPGGQNVNKVNTRVTLLFEVGASASLAEAQKERVCQRLSTRINRYGVLRVVSHRFRTQAANRKAAIIRFARLLAQALSTQRPRKKTSVPRSAKARRLEEKQRRGNLKQSRSKSSLGQEV